MSVIVKAMDKLQNEYQTYSGSLVPTVAVVVMMWNDVKSKGLVLSNPLVDVLLAGIAHQNGLVSSWKNWVFSW
jgi:hypothetical protein